MLNVLTASPGHPVDHHYGAWIALAVIVIMAGLGIAFIRRNISRG